MHAEVCIHLDSMESFLYSNRACALMDVHEVQGVEITITRPTNFYDDNSARRTKLDNTQKQFLSANCTVEVRKHFEHTIYRTLEPKIFQG